MTKPQYVLEFLDRNVVNRNRRVNVEGFFQHSPKREKRSSLPNYRTGIDCLGHPRTPFAPGMEGVEKGTVAGEARGRFLG
jgi:hypothetical protein